MIGLRPATEEDADLLFDWVNRPDSLSGKLRTTGPIPRATHDRWFANRLADPLTRIWIAVDGDGAALGQVRLQADDHEGGFDVDVYVEPSARGRGVARAALRLAEREMPEGTLMVARIRPENLASRRLFEASGYREVEPGAEHLVLEKRVASHNVTVVRLNP